jgi:hypothetical protein
MLNNLVWVAKIILQEINLRAKLHLSNRTPVLIYQMGKVGSTSISNSLEKFNIKPIFQLHFLTKNLKETSEDRDFFDTDKRRTIAMKLKKIFGMRRGYLIYKNIIAPKKQVKIITLTREPIGRNLSAFFQNFERETGNKYQYSNLTPEEIGDIFIKFYPHHLPLNWFDKNIKNYLGIDVYEYPFPRKKGFLTIKNGNIDLLILKSELPNQSKEIAIAEFLQLTDFKILDKNIGDKKGYSDLYKKFKENLKLPKSYLEEMIHSRYFNHFYTEAEIKKVVDSGLIS